MNKNVKFISQNIRGRLDKTFFIKKSKKKIKNVQSKVEKAADF